MELGVFIYLSIFGTVCHLWHSHLNQIHWMDFKGMSLKKKKKQNIVLAAVLRENTG